MFLQMLKDDFPDVRLHIISKLELVNKGGPHNICNSVFLLIWPSHWYRAPLTITPPRHRTTSRRQAMASTISYNRVHPSPSKSARRPVLR